MPFLSASGMSPYNKIRIYSQAGGGELPLLLDVYTGAAAAYSLRKIAAATTNVIRVRRSSDSTEQDFTAEQITDGTLLAFTGSGDGLVTTWYDQSGNNAHATQLAQSNQPRIVLNGALILDISGVNPTIEFFYGASASILNAPLVSAQPLTLFNLRRYRLPGSSTKIAISYAGAGNGYADNNIGGSFRTYYGSYLIQGTNNTSRGLFYSLANGASTAVSLNGGSEVIGNAGTAGASALTIGAAGTSFTTRINEQEVIIYNSNQASNKSGILANINTHYNIYPEPTSGFLYDYPDASLAYSLRQLGVFVGGEANVVRIRRSSNNDEQDFNTTEITDGTLTSFTGSGNGFVSAWYDQSKNGNHATQATLTLQPKLVSSGVVNLENGKPAILYDTSGSQTMTFNNRLTNNRSVFATVNPLTPASSYKQAIMGDSSDYNYLGGVGTQWIISISPAAVSQGNNYINGVSSDLTTTNKAANQQVLISMIHTTSTGISSRISQDRGITTRSWQGNYQELIVFPTDQTSNLTAIDSNINTHYSIYSLSPIDSDAQAYITAGSITDATEIAAINQMFLDLKGTGSTTNNSNIYSKFSALYLMSPTSLAASAINAVTPSTYDITWYNSPTHSVNGVVGNGSNQYGDTGINAFADLISNNCALTVSINNTNTGNGNDTGVRNGSSQAFELAAFSSTYRPRIQTATLGDQMIDSTSPFNNIHTALRRGANDAEYYLNGTSAQTNTTTSGTMPNGNIFLMAENIVGFGPNGFTARQYNTSAIHQGMSGNEVKDLYDAITTYNANVISGGR